MNEQQACEAAIGNALQELRREISEALLEIADLMGTVVDEKDARVIRVKDIADEMVDGQTS